MDNLLRIKAQQINILQIEGWGKNANEVGDLLSVLGESVDLENRKDNSITGFKTRLLNNTNAIVSPIHLDYSIELPLVELFIEEANFVLFTTQFIYNCRKATITKIGYAEIIRIDEKSINKFLYKRLENSQFMDINLITVNGDSVPIVFEYGISFRPIVYFLTIVNKRL